MRVLCAAAPRGLLARCASIEGLARRMEHTKLNIGGEERVEAQVERQMNRVPQLSSDILTSLLI